MDEDYDITSPVRSFLERSKQQVEKYIRQQFNLLNEEIIEEEVEDDEEESSILKTVETSSSSVNSVAFSKLEDFLNPDNSAIKKLIEHRVLKNPTVLSELLNVDFADLLQVFESLTSTTSLEAAYLHLLQLVEDEGAQGISKLAQELGAQADNDEIVQAVRNGQDSSKVDYNSPPSLRLRGLNSQLSDEEISGFLHQHMAAFGQNEEESNENPSKDEL